MEETSAPGSLSLMSDLTMRRVSDSIGGSYKPSVSWQSTQSPCERSRLPLGATAGPLTTQATVLRGLRSNTEGGARLGAIRSTGGSPTKSEGGPL
jgi:hypothetical protein